MDDCHGAGKFRGRICRKVWYAARFWGGGNVGSLTRFSSPPFFCLCASVVERSRTHGATLFTDARMVTTTLLLWMHCRVGHYRCPRIDSWCHTLVPIRTGHSANGRPPQQQQQHHSVYFQYVLPILARQLGLIYFPCNIIAFPAACAR